MITRPNSRIITNSTYIWFPRHSWKGPFLKIQEFSLVMISLIFPQDDNLGLKMTILKFLGLLLNYYWREDRLLIKEVYISTPWHSVFSWIRSLLSWSKIGVLFIGVKLKTSIPTVRRKYESVPPESLVIIFSLQSRI